MSSRFASGPKLHAGVIDSQNVLFIDGTSLQPDSFLIVRRFAGP